MLTQYATLPTQQKACHDKHTHKRKKSKLDALREVLRCLPELLGDLGKVLGGLRELLGEHPGVLGGAHSLLRLNSRMLGGIYSTLG